jgi:hypothetical protein
MTNRSCLLVSGWRFVAVALLHPLRLVNGRDMRLGPWAIPAWASWLGVLVPGALGASAFRLRPRAT